MAKVLQSRFALLKIEDDDDEDEVKTQKSANKNNNQQGASKKKNKKKKKAEQQQENDELKNLAFAKPGSARHRTQSGGSDRQKHKQNGHSGASESQWNDWIKADQNYAAESYEKDLEQALMMSKLDFEQKKEVVKSFKDAGAHVEEEVTKEKKKKKKDKPQTMSLEEFNAGKTSHSDELEHVPLNSHASSKQDTPDVEADPKFFSHVEGDVEKILRKEKIQEEYQKQFAAERVMTSKHQAEITKKDKEIEFLKATVKKLEEEFKQVKKRNKQLCVILAQGEMKEKSEVLMQVQQLSEVKDELTQQVQELTAELEKERSKVHSLKSELDKVKGHGTKHSGK